jgi:hypothetical protein
MGLGADAPTYDVLAANACQASTYAVFAKSTTEELAITGGSNLISGTVHTNQDLKLAGNQDVIKGAAEVVGGVKIAGKGDAVGSTVNAKVADFPFVPQVAGLTPTFSFTGDVDLNSRPEVWSAPGRLKPGVYVATGNLQVSGKGLLGTVTLVGASVGIHCQTGSLTAASRGILAYATGPQGVEISGSHNVLTGLVYAPAGQFQLTGSNNTLRGTVLADQARVAGNTNIIIYVPLAAACAAPAPEPKASATPEPKPSAKPTVKPIPRPQPTPSPTPAACWKVGNTPLIGHNQFWSIWDPHERSGDGAEWGNQDYGQVELLRSATNDLVMQVDQGAEVFGRWTGYTVNHRVAIKDVNDVVVYDGLHGNLKVNGKAYALTSGAPAMLLPCGGRLWVTNFGIEVLTSKRDDLLVMQLVDREGQLSFGLPGGQNRPDFCNIQGLLGQRKCGEVRGGLGSFDGDGNPSNDLKGRCGEAPVAVAQDQATLPRFFGEWRVKPGQSLFN